MSWMVRSESVALESHSAKTRLAVAHSKQCPYCIDSFTAKCLEAGSNPEQMHEALHVAAAMAAGIDLVHGVQMQNALRAKGAIE